MAVVAVGVRLVVATMVDISHLVLRLAVFSVLLSVAHIESLNALVRACIVLALQTSQMPLFDAAVVGFETQR